MSYKIPPFTQCFLVRTHSYSRLPHTASSISYSLASSPRHLPIFIQLYNMEDHLNTSPASSHPSLFNSSNLSSPNTSSSSSFLGSQFLREWMASDAPLASETIVEMWEEEDEEEIEEWDDNVSSWRKRLLYIQTFILFLVLLWFLSMVYLVLYS